MRDVDAVRLRNVFVCQPLMKGIGHTSGLSLTEAPLDFCRGQRLGSARKLPLLWLPAGALK